MDKIILEDEDMIFTVGRTLVLREAITMDVSNRLTVDEITIVIISNFRLLPFSLRLKIVLSKIMNRLVAKIPNDTRRNDAARYFLALCAFFS